MSPQTALNVWQRFLIVAVRLAVGWHLYYQGWGKLQDSHWSSEGYLKSSIGPFASIFKWISESPSRVAVIDNTTIYGLMLLGLLLMLGLFTRTATTLAIILLFSFYLAHPPFPFHGFLRMGPGGPELYVNQLFIEVMALIVSLSFDSGMVSGLDILARGRLRRKSRTLD